MREKLNIANIYAQNEYIKQRIARLFFDSSRAYFFADNSFYSNKKDDLIYVDGIKGNLFDVINCIIDNLLFLYFFVESKWNMKLKVEVL